MFILNSSVLRLLHHASCYLRLVLSTLHMHMTVLLVFNLYFTTTCNSICYVVITSLIIIIFLRTLLFWIDLIKQCPYEGCELEFMRCNQLKIHQFAHTSEKPFKSVNLSNANIFLYISCIVLKAKWPKQISK